MGGGLPSIRDVFKPWRQAGDVFSKPVAKAGKAVKAVYEDAERTVKGATNDAGNTIRNAVDDAQKDLDMGSPNWGSEGSPNLGGKKEDTPDPDPVVPEKGEEGVKKLNARRRAVNRSRSIYSSPLGAGGQANIIRNFLTGK